MELLAKEMRYPRHAMPAAVVGDTFAENRRVNQCLSPNGKADRGMLLKCFHKLFMGNGANQSASHGAKRMIHMLQKKPLGVRPVAWIMKSKVLPGAGSQSVIPGHDALDHDCCGFRFITLYGEILAGREFADFTAQAAYRGNVGSTDGRVVLELSQKNVARRHVRKPDTQSIIINAPGRVSALCQMIKRGDRSRL